MEEAVVDEDLAKYCERVLNISNKTEESIRNTYSETNSGIPVENVLEKVPYSEPQNGIDPVRLKKTLNTLHSMTGNEMRTLLKEAHLSGQGTKKQLRTRLKNFYRKEYAIYRSRHENLSETLKNKTARHFEYLVCLDFECTCEEIIYNYPHEIIEFPAVLVDVKGCKIIDKFRTYVRPELNPKLDPFCTQLTGITQEQVDKAPLFREALAIFLDWMRKNRLGEEGHRYAFVTDGHHDLWKFFQYQCINSGIPSVPHEFRHFINIKQLFQYRCRGKLIKGDGKTAIQHMLDFYNMTFEGSTHSGLDDAINIARLAIRMMLDKIELRINQRIVRRNIPNAEKRAEELAQKEPGRDDFIWMKKLPLKCVTVTRDDFYSMEYLDCDSCDEE